MAYPGEHIMLGIKALDEIERSTSDIIRLSDLSDNVKYLCACSTVCIYALKILSDNNCVFIL